MSREAKIKATAGALQAKTLDLTQFARARSADNTRAMKVRTEDAAGALGFAAGDVTIDGEVRQGDELPGLLLRLKYANQWAKANFQRAHLILLHRHGWNPRMGISEVMFAIAYAAIVEWVNDPCPKCRGARLATSKPRACPECTPKASNDEPIGRVEREPYVDPWGQSYPDRTGAPIMRSWRTTSPRAGCLKCKGMGRIFAEVKPSKGIRCLPCGSTGRTSFPVKQRYFLVRDFLDSVAKAKNVATAPLDLKNFRDHWMSRYHKFLGVLRDADKHHIGATLDFGIAPSQNRATPESLPFLEDPTTEAPQGAQDQPEGELPPEET